MAASNPTIFVCSATGAQGMALSRQLRKISWDVHTTVRNPESAATKALEAEGVKVTVGDWNNKEALTASIAGCDGIFLNLVPSFPDWDQERLQAHSILTIAKAAGVKHIVYSSAMTAGAPEKRSGRDPSSPAHKLFFSKNTVEGLVKRAGFEHWTILRGGFFMANFLEPKVRIYPDLLKANTFKTAMTAETGINVIDHEDIAKFAVAAFQDPERFNQQAIELAGEALTSGQLMEQLSAATGRQLKAVFYSEDEIKEHAATNPLIESQLSMRESHRFIRIEEVKSWGIPLTTFQDFLQREKVALDATYH